MKGGRGEPGKKACFSNFFKLQYLRELLSYKLNIYFKMLLIILAITYVKILWLFSFLSSQNIKRVCICSSNWIDFIFFFNWLAGMDEYCCHGTGRSETSRTGQYLLFLFGRQLYRHGLYRLDDPHLERLFFCLRYRVPGSMFSSSFRLVPFW